MEISGLGPVTPQFNVLLNVSCAFLPLTLSLLLFCSSRERSIFWWLGMAVFVAFLPTAPYTLTDIIHFISTILNSQPLSLHHIVLIQIPFYGVYMLVCFQAYVISVMLLKGYIVQQEMGAACWGIPIEFLLSFLSAVGIYLGRFHRLSSWNLANKPVLVLTTILQNLPRPFFWMFVLESFIIITGLYYTLKIINISLWKTFILPKWIQVQPTAFVTFLKCSVSIKMSQMP